MTTIRVPTNIPEDIETGDISGYIQSAKLEEMRPVVFSVSIGVRKSVHPYLRWEDAFRIEREEEIGRATAVSRYRPA